MKLRIRGNSIRLRLLRSEVDRLAREGTIEETISFGLGEEQKITYAIRSAIEVIDIAARYGANRITVAVPAQLLKHWFDSDQVSIEATQRVDELTCLSILIEKDFKCLDRKDADSADAYEHPTGSKTC